MWGGALDASVTLLARADGAAFNPSTGAWRKLPDAPLAARTGQIGTWTGREMLIWGGRRASGAGTQVLADGAAYNPKTNRWRRLPPSPLSARTDAIAVWTGSTAIVLGGSGDSEEPFQSLPDAASYDPVKNSWRMITALNAAHTPFAWRTAIQAGTRRLLGWTSWVKTSGTADS